MRIGFLSPLLPDKCGIAIYSNNLLKELIKTKKADIITLGNEVSDADYKINFKAWNLKNKIKKIIEKENIELLHIQYNPTFFGKYNLNLNLLSALKQKIPIVVTLHEVHYEAAGLRDKVIMWLEQRIAKNVNAIVHTRQQKTFLKGKAKNIECIYHGLETYGINKRKDKNLLSFGIISENKGVKYLIRAMNFLPEYNLTIAGKVLTEKLEKELLEEINRCANKKIKYKFEWVTEKERWQRYKKADLVVLSHTWAPFQSGILHNAASVGLPVVVTRTGSIYEMVELFGFGEIVKPKDPEAIAQAVKKIFENYDYYQKNVKKYRKEAGWKKTAEKHLALYKEIINKRIIDSTIVQKSLNKAHKS